ncbi:MAG: rhodanese-like domain-containing protein [Candidatus Baltobacteraceae bacterium]
MRSLTRSADKDPNIFARFVSLWAMGVACGLFATTMTAAAQTAAASKPACKAGDPVVWLTSRTFYHLKGDAGYGTSPNGHYACLSAAKAHGATQGPQAPMGPRAGQGTMKSISVEDLKRLRESGVPVFLLDVREPDEVAAGAIAGSVNIPMNQVQARIGELPKDREIVVMCRSGHRSARVTAMLNALGYTNAVNLSGGMSAWLQRIAP